MLTKISATTAAFVAVVNALVLFGVLDWTQDEIAAVSLAITAVGTVVHAWFNPKVPLGVK